MDFLIGLDLGQVADPTALVITEVQWPTTAEDRPRYQGRAETHQPVEPGHPSYGSAGSAICCQLVTSR